MKIVFLSVLQFGVLKFVMSPWRHSTIFRRRWSSLIWLCTGIFDGQKDCAICLQIYLLVNSSHDLRAVDLIKQAMLFWFVIKRLTFQAPCAYSKWCLMLWLKKRPSTLQKHSTLDLVLCFLQNPTGLKVCVH